MLWKCRIHQWAITIGNKVKPKTCRRYAQLPLMLKVPMKFRGNQTSSSWELAWTQSKSFIMGVVSLKRTPCMRDFLIYSLTKLLLFHRFRNVASVSFFFSKSLNSSWEPTLMEFGRLVSCKKCGGMLLLEMFILLE